jgi:uncharacterized protein
MQQLSGRIAPADRNPSPMLTVQIVLAAAAAYAVLCGAVYMGQYRIVYLEWLIAFKPPVLNLAGAQEMHVDCGDARIKIWVLHPERRPALIYLGGSSEDVSINLGIFDTLFPEHAVYLVCYRGYPGSTGRPSEPRLIADAGIIFDRLATRHERIAVIGKSLGTGIAAALATRTRLEKMILVTPYDSLANLAADTLPFLPARWLLKDGYHSVPRIRQIRVPVLVVLAENDGLVLPERSDPLIAAIPAGYRHVCVIDGAHHTNLRSFSAYGQSMKDFVTDHAAAAAARWQTGTDVLEDGPELDTGAA